MRDSPRTAAALRPTKGLTRPPVRTLALQLAMAIGTEGTCVHVGVGDLRRHGRRGPLRRLRRRGADRLMGHLAMPLAARKISSLTGSASYSATVSRRTLPNCSLLPDLRPGNLAPRGEMV